MDGGDHPSIPPRPPLPELPEIVSYECPACGQQHAATAEGVAAFVVAHVCTPQREYRRRSEYLRSVPSSQ